MEVQNPLGFSMVTLFEIVFRKTLRSSTSQEIITVFPEVISVEKSVSIWTFPGQYI